MHLTLLQILCRECHWKNFGNWSIIGEHMDKSKVPHFLAHPVYLCIVIDGCLWVSGWPKRSSPWDHYKGRSELCTEPRWRWTGHPEYLYSSKLGFKPLCSVDSAAIQTPSWLCREDCWWCSHHLPGKVSHFRVRGGGTEGNCPP